MKPKITFNIEDNVLTCFITGERRGDSVLDIWEQLVNKCHHENISLVQVTMALRGKYEPFQAIEIYQSAIEMVKPAGLKVAVVDLNYLSAPDTQVACNMAVGKGLDACFFQAPATARAWLLEKSQIDSSATSKNSA